MKSQHGGREIVAVFSRLDFAIVNAELGPVVLFSGERERNMGTVIGYQKVSRNSVFASSGGIGAPTVA